MIQQSFKFLTTRVLIGLLLIFMTAFAFSQERVARSQEEATPIEEGVMTERERVHARLFDSHGTSSERLSDLIARRRHDIGISSTSCFGGDPNAPPFDPSGYVHRLSCGADAIVIGVLKSKSSQLTESGTYIFSDYEVTIEEVFKDNMAAPIQNGNEIIVTRPGGRIRLNGYTVEATSNTFRPFIMGGRYILFLRLVPESGAYVASGDKSFELLGDNIRVCGEYPFAFRLQQETAANFVTYVRNAVATSCEGISPH